MLPRQSLQQSTGEHRSALHVSKTTIKTGHFKTGQGLFQNKPTQHAAVGQYLPCLKYFDINELQNTDTNHIGFDLKKENVLQGICGILTEIAFDKRKTCDTSKLTENCTSLYLAASAQLCTDILQDGEKDFRQLFDREQPQGDLISSTDIEEFGMYIFRTSKTLRLIFNSITLDFFLLSENFEKFFFI